MFSDYRPPRLGAALFISALCHALLVSVLSLESASRWLTSIDQKVPTLLEVRMVPRTKSVADVLPPRPILPEPELSAGLPAIDKVDAKKPSEVVEARMPVAPEAPVRIESKVGTVAERDVVINLETGERLVESEQAETRFEAPPVGFTIQVSPAGKMEKWSSDSELPAEILTRLQLLNNLIRNMQFERTGESHSVAWLAYLVEKDGVWVAKLQPREEGAHPVNTTAP